MNYHCAQDLLKFNNGIFRSTIVKKDSLQDSSVDSSVDSLQESLQESLPEEVNKFIKIWNSSSGQYIDLQAIADKQLIRHDLLELDAYIHITSPIRRLVDLLNMIKFQQNHGLISLSADASQFYDKWLKEIDYINITMRSIRKVQNDCNLLDLCYNDPQTLEKTYDGYCFDKLAKNDGLYQFMVFLPELRLSSRITVRDNLENYDKKQFKLFIFNNEEKFKRKIRLQLI
jgi:exoribonuclease R